MIQKARQFFGCQRGNIAFMTAGAMVPLLTLTAGGLEFAEYQRVQTSMQLAADQAVLSAFDQDRRGWSRRIKRAHRFFDVNFKHRSRVTQVKKRLRGRNDRRKMVLSFEASGKLNSLFGEFNPFAKDRVIVRSRAVLHYGSGSGPRLIAPVSELASSR